MNEDKNIVFKRLVLFGILNFIFIKNISVIIICIYNEMHNFFYMNEVKMVFKRLILFGISNFIFKKYIFQLILKVSVGTRGYLRGDNTRKKPVMRVPAWVWGGYG
jgi:hypothetical protein